MRMRAPERTITKARKLRRDLSLPEVILWDCIRGRKLEGLRFRRQHPVGPYVLVGDFVIWLFENLAGIKPDPAQPGFKHMIMKPQPVTGLAFVKATHESPYGLISSEWHKTGDQFDWQIQIPVNTTASVYVPATSPDSVKVKGLKASRFENGQAIFELGSGKYHFISK